MTYKTIMVHLDLEQYSEPALRVTCELADRFKSKVIGVTAGLPNVPIHADGMIASNVLEADYEQLNQAIGRCESHFRSALKDFNGALEWRSDAAYPVDFLVQEARAADLLVVGRAENYNLLGPNHLLEIGDAVMKAGRPVLVVPPRSTSLAFNRILIAWKDSAEARRALPAALPLLKRAKELIIVEITSDESERGAANERVADVAKWLQRHNVPASARVEPSAGAPGSQLEAIASEARADIIVAGAYGHTRLHEWIFGGVTRHLLQHGSTCALLVH
ncbi:universal stress protein [Bradyrhizobium sediminis]|uniref:Universal stress protein n=1 Tax=Bradyrhizobium sediminis TaxID=2840469 RepID=A0A975N9S1_9BRAD|nr:universal stress protein [Bradyrhizobium sediminis]QWG11122.1 universal stress protein [Bradyrhizobium sediminis]